MGELIAIEHIPLIYFGPSSIWRGRWGSLIQTPRSKKHHVLVPSIGVANCFLSFTRIHETPLWVVGGGRKYHTFEPTDKTMKLVNANIESVEEILHASNFVQCMSYQTGNYRSNL